MLFLLPLPGVSSPARNPCPVFPLSLLEMVMGRYEPKAATWASTAPPVCTSWCSATSCMVQSPSGTLLPCALEDGHCLHTFLGVPSVSSGLLEQKGDEKWSKGQWKCFQCGAPMGSLASSIRCPPWLPSLSVYDGDRFSCHCCLIIKRFCFWQ